MSAAKIRWCSCPAPGCTWGVWASAGYASPRLRRHQASDCPKVPVKKAAR